MSPTRILQSCGNSSRLLLRRKLPIGVRCALGSASKCVATAGVPTRMLRNFGILNNLLCRPTRSDQYKAGPAEVSRTATATRNTGTAKTTAAAKASKRSKSASWPPSVTASEARQSSITRRPPQAATFNGCTLNLRPIAFITFITVDRLGLPSPESAL